MSNLATIQEIDQWHADRMLGIGGSDCAAALGYSKFKTPYDLYREKRGESAPVDETWEMKRGKVMEPLLRQHYADTTGREVRLPAAALVHPKYEFMRYNPDGLSDDGRLQEFKTASYGREWGEVGTDEVPQEYILQVQHGMIVTGLFVTDVTVSIGGSAPKYFVVEADRELQDMIIDREAAFWEMVKNGTPPDPISNTDVASRYCKTIEGSPVVINLEIAADLVALKDIKQQTKRLEKQQEELEVKIKHYMGENEILTDEFATPLATWKQQKGARRIDAELLRSTYPDVAEIVTKQGDPFRRFLLK